jgi:hypothetical protein
MEAVARMEVEVLMEEAVPTEAIADRGLVIVAKRRLGKGGVFI